MFCTNCGKDNPDSNKFCMQCGRPMAAAGQEAGPTPAPAATATPAAQTPPRHRARRLPLLVGGVMVMVLATAAWFLLPRLTGGGGGGNELLLAATNRRFLDDLYVLRLGDDLAEDAVVIAEGVSRPERNAIFALQPAGSTYDSSPGSEYGFFPTGKNRLLTLYTDESETRLVEYVLGSEAPTEIYADDTDQFSAGYSPDQDIVMIFEYASNPMRCYIANPGQEAKRVARGESCFMLNDGSRVLVHDWNSNNEKTIKSFDLNGDNEVVLLDDVSALRDATSADASHVVYTERISGGVRVTLLNAEGEELYQSDTFREVSHIGFVGASDVAYFVGDNDDGAWELHTSAGAGPLAAAPAMTVFGTSDDKTLAVLTADEDGESQVSVINIESGASVEVASGDDLMMRMAGGQSWILVLEQFQGDIKLVASGIDGANPVTLFDDGEYVYQSGHLLPDDGHFLMELRNADNEASLFVAPLDGSPGYFVVEDWYEFRLLNHAGGTVLLTGQEDQRDDPVLFAFTMEAGAKLVELDDEADRYGYAVITPDGRSALYNAIIGDDVDDVVVRRVLLNGEESPEDLYDKMWLQAVRWTDIDPMQFGLSDWAGAGRVALTMVGGAQRISGNFHAGAVTRVDHDIPAISNQTIQGDLLAFEGFAGQRVEIDVFGRDSITSNLDPHAVLLDKDMNFIDSDDDGGNGLDSRITTTLPEDGIYYLFISSYSFQVTATGNELAYEVHLSRD